MMDLVEIKKDGHTKEIPRNGLYNFFLNQTDEELEERIKTYLADTTYKGELFTELFV